MKLKYNPKNENSLEEIWIKLAKLYENQADEYIQSQRDKFSTLTNIQSALAELKVGLETMDLVEKGNITKIPIQTQNNFKNNFHLKIQNISPILLKSKTTIEEFLKKENETFPILKFLGSFSIKKGLIYLEALNMKLQITFDGEILNCKFENEITEKNVNFFDFNEFLIKETQKKLKKEDFRNFAIEKVEFNKNFAFFKSYVIKVQFDDFTVHQFYFCGQNFKEIFKNSVFISKIQGKYKFKKLILEITGHKTEILNIKTQFSPIIFDNSNIFINWINNSLINEINLAELFPKIVKYVCYFVLKNIKKCTEVFFEDECYYGISEDIYRIDKEMIVYKNEIKEN